MIALFNCVNKKRKDLGVILDENFNFHGHIKRKTKSCSELIGTSKFLSVHLPIKSLLTTYKSFFRPHLEYIWRYNI